MSDHVMVALIGAVPASLGTLVAAFNLWKLARVHDAVNGGLAQVKADLAAKIAELAEMKRQRDDLRSGSD